MKTLGSFRRTAESGALPMLESLPESGRLWPWSSKRASSGVSFVGEAGGASACRPIESMRVLLRGTDADAGSSDVPAASSAVPAGAVAAGSSDVPAA